MAHLLQNVDDHHDGEDGKEREHQLSGLVIDGNANLEEEVADGEPECSALVFDEIEPAKLASEFDLLVGMHGKFHSELDQLVDQDHGKCQPEKLVICKQPAQGMAFTSGRGVLL